MLKVYNGFIILRFKDGSAQVNPAGIRFNPLIIGPVVESNDGLQVRCKVVYTSDSDNSFIGGSVTSGAMTLSYAQITTFAQPSADLKIGDTIALTCIAKAAAEPTFSFFLGTKNIKKDTRYEEVEGPTVTADGSEYTAIYKTKAVRANIRNNGNTITCEANYGPGKGESKKDLLVKVYYDCATEEILSLDPDVTVTKVTNDDGSVTATGTCKPNTDDTRYIMGKIIFNISCFNNQLMF